MIDLFSLLKEEVALPTIITPKITIQQILEWSLKESYSRLGASSIYRSSSKTIIVRYSQYYNRPDENYWFATTSNDLERVNKYSITHFAFVCVEKGVVLIPKGTMLEAIQKDNLNKTTTKQGELRHYHIHFNEKNNSLNWRLKTENRPINNLFYPLSVT